MRTRRIVAIGLLLAAGGALLALQRRLVTTEITPRPLLYLIADTEREAERIPLALTRVSDKEENQIGQELARSYGLTPAVHKDADAQRIAAYVQEVGKRLTVNVKRKEIQYRFFYKDEPYFVNAGALPGGQIVIGRGLLELLESEDELAAILGHEIAHVDERHAIERLQYEVQSKKIRMRELYRLGQIGVVLFQMGYTKQKEDEADRIGLGLTVRAGYSPAGAVEVMKRFDRLFGGQARTATSPVEELAGMPLRSLREYILSHRPARERVATLEKEIQARGYNAAQAQKPLGVRAIFLAEQAKVLDQHGMFDRAIARYQEALKADPQYVGALDGLAQTHWRSGDAEGAVRAASEAVRHFIGDARMWRLLASALAASDRMAAPRRFEALYRELISKQGDLMDVQAATEVSGLKLFAGEANALEAYQKRMTFAMTLEQEITQRKRIAWWMWRAGKAQEALQELEAARQKYPQVAGVGTEMAWALSDMGRQADALQRMEGLMAGGGVMVTPQGVASNLYGTASGDGENEVLSAVITWRTGQRDEAKASFQRAALADPVWMVSKWVANNYSAEATAVIAKLQAEEMARRRKEEAKRTAASKR